MRDDVAFQSQEFREQVEQRRDRYSQQQQDTWAQLPNAVTRYQQAAAGQMQQQAMAQEMDLDRARTASTLATDQLRRQQAVEELAFARELHSTDMIEAQKRTVVAQSSLAEAQARKAIEQLGGARDVPERGWTPDEIHSAWSMGMDRSIEGGKFRIVNATPDKVAAGKAYVERNSRAAVAQTYADQRADAAERAAQSRIEVAERNAAARLRVAEMSGQRKGKLEAYIEMLDSEEASLQTALRRKGITGIEKESLMQRLKKLDSERTALRAELQSSMTGGDDFMAQMNAALGEAAKLLDQK